MPIATRGSPRRAAASPKRAAASPKRAAPKKTPSKAPAKSPKRARTPSRSTTAEPSYKKLAAELSAARDELSLTTQPLTTLRLFALALSDFAVSFLGSVALSKQALVVGYPLLALWAGTHAYAPALYAVDGALFWPELILKEAAWWLVLGVLSSIGFGSGLHSGLMFLFPFCMTVVTTAERCQSTHFLAVYQHPDKLTCDAATYGDGSRTFLGQLILVWPAFVLWGVGTAMGELPPYFVTRAARRAGKDDEAFQKELAEARDGHDVFSKLKVWTIDFTERLGFLGVLLLASWPNAAFDMCGMACGYLNMPFWTFFGATALGKGVVKVTFQACFFITLFSKEFFALVTGALDAVEGVFRAVVGGPTVLAAFAGAQRAKLISKFELAERLTVNVLLEKARTAKDGGKKLYKGGDADLLPALRKLAGWDGAATGRVVGAWDADKNGKLSTGELGAALSDVDDRLSLHSLDPGDGSWLNFGTLWNALIAGLILFFVYTVVEAMARSKQAELDEATLAKKK